MSFFRLVYRGWTINLRPKETANSLSRRETDTDGVTEDGALWAPNPPGRLKNCERKSHERYKKDQGWILEQRADEIATSEGIWRVEWKIRATRRMTEGANGKMAEKKKFEKRPIRRNDRRITCCSDSRITWLTMHEKLPNVPLPSYKRLSLMYCPNIIL